MFAVTKDSQRSQFGSANLKVLLLCLACGGTGFLLSSLKSENNPNQLDLTISSTDSESLPEQGPILIGSANALPPDSDLNTADEVTSKQLKASKILPLDSVDLRPEILLDNLPITNEDGKATNQTVVQYGDLIEERAESARLTLERIEELKSRLEPEVFNLLNDQNGFQIKQAWEKAIEAYEVFSEDPRYNPEAIEKYVETAEEIIRIGGYDTRPPEIELRAGNRVIEHISEQSFGILNANFKISQVLACFYAIESYLHPKGSDGITIDSETGKLAIIELDRSITPASDVLTAVADRFSRLAINRGRNR
ncbi:MAG: hypothetical protein R3A13_07405 [Bdellovibrionota bacterium]